MDFEQLFSQSLYYHRWHVIGGGWVGGRGLDEHWERVGSRNQVKPYVMTVCTSYESKKRQLQAQTCLEAKETSHYHWGEFQIMPFM